MSEDIFAQFFSKKAYEISYAIFRLTGGIKKQSFSSHLEDGALSLLTSAVSGNYQEMKISAAAVKYLLRLGNDIGIVSPGNFEIIAAELNILDAAIAEFDKSAKSQQINLNDVFSKISIPTENSVKLAKNEEHVRRESHNVVIDGNEENQQFANLSNGNGNHNGSGIVKSAMRQAAILERIRQNGNCRLKDIQEMLPETSERTIRYDIQNLAEQGLIERIGNGGPATSYVVKT